MNEITKISIEYQDGHRVNMDKALCIDLSGEEHVDMLFKDVEITDVHFAIACFKYIIGCLEKIASEEPDCKE